MRTKEKVPQSAPSKSKNAQPLPEAARMLAKYGFYFSLSVFLYAVLFPFHFDFSWRHVISAWSQTGFIPFWNAKKGLHIAADDLANILLTFPLGFFGFLHFCRRNGKWAIYKWLAFGFAFGLGAELLQLVVPSRASQITDIVNNSLGAFLGAAVASAKGRPALEFFTGVAAERRNIYLWMLIWSLVAMVGPYDLSQDSISQINPVVPLFESPNSLIGAEWPRIAGFAIIGALAARLAVPGRRKRNLQQPLAAAALVLLFPAILQCLRLLVESEGPSLDDLALDVFGALAGAFISLFLQPTLQSLSAFLLFNSSLIAAGLSPYHFSRWGHGVIFQWIPFHDFCSNRSPAAFYESILAFFCFAILGGLLQLSFPPWRRLCIAIYAAGFSGAIEFAQTFLPARTAGITDVIIAGLAAWIGAHICAAVESERLSQKLFSRGTCKEIHSEPIFSGGQSLRR
jgi:glycopeptide antibiotics resistance protein